MEFLPPTNLIILALCVVAAAIVGYLLGARQSRSQKKELLRELNKQSLDMLDVKSKHSKLSKFLGQSKRKDRLLRHTLKELKAANQRAELYSTRLARIEKQHFIKSSRLRLLATQATEKARRATKIANTATAQLKKIEKAVPTQTINAPPPKSYGQGAAVPVRVVDQQSPEAQIQSAVRVSNRDSARFTRMRSSNEGQRFNSANLQAIEGIDHNVEQKLNSAGIHRIEQLANMSDSDLEELSIAFGVSTTDETQNYTAAWKGGAQRLLGRS